MKTTIVEERNVNQDTIDELKNLALEKMNSINALRGKIKELNQMMKDALENDADYMEAAKEADEAAKVKKVEKARIEARREMLDFTQTVKDLRKEVKEKQGEISDYLLEYERLSGKSTLTTAKGEQLTIFKTATVSRVNS